MSLIHLPQAKWGSGTGRQVILKGDFDKIEQAVLEGFEFARAPPWNTWTRQRPGQCHGRLQGPGDVVRFSFAAASGPVGGRRPGDGRYRENSTPVTLNFATTGSLWGTEKPNQWYAFTPWRGPATPSSPSRPCR